MITDFSARRILLCLRYGIGDVVMERPALEALRRFFPEAWITALGAAPATELLHGEPIVDEVVEIQRWGLTHRWDPGSEEARADIARWLDASGFDLFLDLHHAAPPFGDLVWRRGIRSLESDEAAEAAAVAAGADGVRAIREAVRVGWGMPLSADAFPRIPLRPEDRRFAASFLDAHGMGSTSPIGISPVASLPLKRWPVERFAAVADALSGETGRPVLIFSGPQTEIADRLRDAMRSTERVVWVGAFHLKRVAALLARCGLFVCNDTGLMHLAAAAGTPTVAVFGPTSPRIYGPPQDHARSLGGIGTECRYHNAASLHPPQCFAQGDCLQGGPGCIQRVGTEEVLDAALRALRQARADADPLLAAG